MHDKQKIYIDLESHFVYDYIFFSTHLRLLQTEENGYKKYPLRDTTKRLCLVNMFELYQKSLEDLGAVTLAFYRRYNSDTDCKFQKEFTTNETPLVYTLINYKPGDADLTQLLTKFSTEHEIIEKLGIINFEHINIKTIYSDINFQKVYTFFTIGLRSLGGDQRSRLKMFNKIKHGGVVLGDGSLPFSNNLVKGTPAVIYADPIKFRGDDHPLVIHGLKYTDDEFELMKAGVWKIVGIIKILLSIYLCREYEDFLLKKYPTNPLKILQKIKLKQILSLWNGY